MLRGYTDNNDGAPTAFTSLACSVTLQSSAHGTRLEQATRILGRGSKSQQYGLVSRSLLMRALAAPGLKKYCGDFDPLCGSAHLQIPEQLASSSRLPALQCMLQPLTRRPLTFLQCRCPEHSSDREWQSMCGACRGVHEAFYGNLDQKGNPARSATAMVEKPALGKRLSTRSPHPLAAKWIFSIPVFWMYFKRRG